MRAPRYQFILLQLAFVAALLMAVAPVVSRGVQAGQMPHAGMVATSSALHQSAHPTHGDAHVAHHAMSGEAHAALRVGLVAESLKQKAPADPHAAHGEACDYCTMASRLLPWLAVLLVFAPLLYRHVPDTLRTILLLVSLRWPAHPVRGPPLFS